MPGQRRDAASQPQANLAYLAPHNVRSQKVTALHPLFEIVGSVAACITTFAWLPQIMKILRERQARDISLITTAALASGVFLWIVYGIAIGSLPVIMANTVSFLFIATIVGLKLRYG